MLFIYIKELHISKSLIQKEIYTQKKLYIEKLNFKKDLYININIKYNLHKKKRLPPKMFSFSFYVLALINEKY